jgi:thioester reductase-like protein
MCGITEKSTTPQQTHQLGQVMPSALLVAALVLRVLWSRDVPLSALSPPLASIACAMILALLASFVLFVNFYSGKKLRACSPMTMHLAAMSKKQSAPEDWLVDLDKVANPEGLSNMWKDQVLNKGVGYKILLTGATGYVGRAFLFQLLREIANGKATTGEKIEHKVYVMARAKARKNLSAAQRLETLRDEPMFAPYRKQWDEVVVAAQSGDLQEASCGMSEETLDMLAGANITHVVHCAADVNFNRPLADSAGINISPALQLQALAQQWSSCKRFIHCSTAFVNPGHGSDEAPMLEQLFSLGKYDPQALYESMRGDQKLALAVKEELAFPNNYVFTKCVAEHLVVRGNKHMELKIVRPAIVGPAWALPEPGWNGEKPSTITALLLLWGTRVIRFAPLTKQAIPMIPVDVVAVGIIHAMISPAKIAEKANSSGEKTVSIRNLIWSHKSPRSCIDGMTMANVCLSSAVMKHHFSSSETAVSFALIDIVYKIPQLFPILHLIFNLGPLYFLQLVCWAVKLTGIKSVLEQVPVVKLLKFSDMLTLVRGIDLLRCHHNDPRRNGSRISVLTVQTIHG